jgi:hypothetical protein
MNDIAKSSRTTQLFDLIRQWSPLIAVIVAVATFLGLQPSKKKLLEWEYVAKNTLVNPSIGPVEKIEINYDGQKIDQLTAISGRLVNSGQVPISSNPDELEEPPQLEFSDQTRIIGATITSRKNANGTTISDLKASCVITDNILRIDHGLLNPGDSVYVQILLQGDPGDIDQLPQVTYRIANIIEPSTRYPESKSEKPNPVFFDFSKSINFLLLLFSTLLPLMMIGASLFVAWESIKKLSVRSDLTERITALENYLKNLDIERVLLSAEMDKKHMLLKALCFTPVNENWLVNSEEIEGELNKPMYNHILEEIEMTTSEAASLLKKSLRESFATGIEERIDSSNHLDSKNALKPLLSYDANSYDDLKHHYKEAVEQLIDQRPMSVRIRASSGEFVAMLFMFTISAATFLTTVNCWWIFFAH